MARKITFENIFGWVPQRKRPGIHSKNRHTNQKHGKYYAGSKYRGQGR